MTKPYSTIGLKTYFEFPGRIPPERVTLSQADFFLEGTGVRLPDVGHTFLYGYKTSRFLLGSAISRAMDHNHEFCLVNAEARIGEWDPNKIRLETLPITRFVNLPGRANKGLLDDLREKWVGILQRHGLSPDDDGFPRKPSLNMHLLGELIKIPPYDQLTALAYHVPTTVGVANLVTVFDKHNLTLVDANTIHPVDVDLVFS